MFTPRFFPLAALLSGFLLFACSSADTDPGETSPAGQAGAAGQGPAGQAGAGFAGQQAAGQAGSGQAGSGPAGGGPAGSGPAGSGQAGSGQAGSGGAAGAGVAGSGGQDSWENTPYGSEVVSFMPGMGAGFGQDKMPEIVLGPPKGAIGSDGKPSTLAGGLDVVSLGVGGVIVLRLGLEVIDGPGVDLLVFENAFFAGGDPHSPWKELGEVSVSEDGESWVTFPCDTENYAQSSCAGWHPVLSNPADGISATDPAVAGGDPFDLATIGVSRARFVKIRDLAKGGGAPTAGFDLDAVSVVNAGAP